jgi:ABC-type Na+ efflux pump permease subunit
MIHRIARLVRAELLKLAEHPFFVASLVIVALGTAAGALFLGETPSTAWRAPHAIAIFAAGAKVGLKLAMFVVTIFGAMLFAGEFDRGTIKILLTRPITRTDLFLAKCSVAFILAVLLAALVLTTSFAVGCARGELGPVWDDSSYNSNTSYERLMEHTRKAVSMSVAAVVAAAFFGVLVSNCSTASGFAVAVALTLFLVTDEVLLRAFREDEMRRYFFSVYPGYALDVLRDFARGSSTKWNDAYEQRAAYASVPLGSSLIFGLIGYGVFRLRNITV